MTLLMFYLLRDVLGKRAPQLYQRLKIILASTGVYLSTHFIGSPKLSFSLGALRSYYKPSQFLCSSSF